MKQISAGTGNTSPNLPARPAWALDPARRACAPRQTLQPAVPVAGTPAMQDEEIQQAIHLADDSFRTIFDHSNDAILVIDPITRHVLDINPRACDLLGYALEQLPQLSMDVLYADETPAMSRFIRSVLEQGAGSTSELRVRTASGRVLPVDISASRIDLDGRPHLLATLRDISGRHSPLRPLRAAAAQSAPEIESGFGTIIGEAPVMRSLFEAVAQVADSDATVLLIGETGTGKEVIAREIHERSARRNRRLVKLNCAALPSELVESELFGYEKGAFTGAISQHKGRFETADGGTLFLDEVGDLAAPAQAKLLRVLEEQEFERVGGTRSVQVDVRVIAATNRDLADMVRDGAFRVDLYYRLNVFPIPLPPLRERRSDIPLLLRFFADRFARKMGKTITGIDPRSLQRLTEYAWPGNVRELQNVVERAVILARGGLLDVEVALQRRLDEPLEEAHDLLRQNGSGTLEAMERTYIRQILEDRDWIIEGPRGAAALLGLKPSTLRSRMRKLHIGRQTSLPGAPRDGLAQRQQGL